MLITERKLRETIRSVLLENYEIKFKDVNEFVETIQNCLDTVLDYGRGEYEMMKAILMLFQGTSYSFVDLESFNEDLQNKNKEIINRLAHLVNSNLPEHSELINRAYGEMDSARY